MIRRARPHPGPGAAGRTLERSGSAPTPHRAAHAARSPWTGWTVPRPGHHARHVAPARLHISPFFACIGALVLVAGGAALGSVGAGGALAATVSHGIPNAGPGGGVGGNVSTSNAMAQGFAGAPSAAILPAATAPPAPAPPSLQSAPALRPHEIFGFAPYWALPTASEFDLAGLTTLSYFSVDVGGDATVQQSGPGWVGYQSQALATLVTRAHAAGDRVVLTASCFGQSALDQMAADPSAGPRLAAQLVQLVTAKNLDGVNLDFEGKGDKDQAGLDTLVAAVSTAMRQADPHWQVTMDTYASAAGDPTGFYDIAALAPSVDAFFVMAYDMNNKTTPSATAPLTGAGFTDLEAVQQYAAVVPPSKVILGVPYYGYDWPTAGPGLGDPATGPATPLHYSQIVATGGHVYWDPATQTPWTSYQVGSQWHQTFFDNPTSLALKAQLADTYHLAGLGIWALGMEGVDPAMQAALVGGAPVLKGLKPGPVGSATTTTAAPATYSYAGTWNGVAVILNPIDPASVAGAASIPASSPLTGFTTDDPTRSCLEAAAALPVTELVGSPGVDILTTTTPTECAAGTWEFTVPESPADAPTTTTSTTTSTTQPGSTTSTSSTTSTTGASSTSTTI
jgi:Glycosyl hydrolases family 18